jgi:uncharacterized protein (DUF433 family)
MDYISLDEGGTARIAGTGIKVRILAEELRAGYRPEDIHAAHDGLSMAQVYAALAYYYANKAAFDESIDRGVHAATEDLAEADHVLSRETLVNRLQARSHGSDA